MAANTQTMNTKELNEEKKESTLSVLLGWIKFIIVLGVVFFIFRYALGIVIIDGNSMNPTLQDSDIVITNNIFYEHDRNDIVIINENGFNIVKRIIALPNETVEIKNGVVLVNGEPLEENYTTGIPNDMPEVFVQEGTYFVIGDNRTPGESLDSRSSDIGLIPIEKTLGEAFFSIKSLRFL